MLALTIRKKPSTNRPAAIVSIDSIAARRLRHRLSAASLKKYAQRPHQATSTMLP